MTDLHNYAICSFYYGTQHTEQVCGHLHYPVVPTVIPLLFTMENNKNNASVCMKNCSQEALGLSYKLKEMLFYIITYLVRFFVIALTSQVCPPYWTSPDTTHSPHVYMCNTSMAWHNNSNSATSDHNSKACTTSDSIINFKGHEELYNNFAPNYRPLLLSSLGPSYISLWLKASSVLIKMHYVWASTRQFPKEVR